MQQETAITIVGILIFISLGAVPALFYRYVYPKKQLTRNKALIFSVLLAVMLPILFFGKNSGVTTAIIFAACFFVIRKKETDEEKKARIQKQYDKAFPKNY